MRNPSTPGVSESSVRLLDSVRATFAGNIATRVAGSAATLFYAGGHRVLNASARAALAAAAEKGAARALAVTSAPMIAAAQEAGLSSKLVPSVATSDLAVAVAGQTARGAAKAVLRGAGRAAGIGFALDGAIASVGAVLAVRRGDMDRGAAVKHVAKEAASGAFATGAGVLLGAGLVAVTGGVAAPAVFAVAAIGSIGAKHAARRALG
ncbi:MAG: hypothetical protein R3B36_12930 [Polyangiaceae bacterium]